MGYAFAMTLTLLLGCATFAALIFTLREVFTERDLGGTIAGALMTVMLAVISLVPLGFYDYAMSPEFVLKKAEWECTASHQDDDAGTICDAYRRRI